MTFGAGSISPLQITFSPTERWQDYASCHGIETAMFYPEQGDDFSARLAKKVCRGCDVVSECLEDALLTIPRDDYGIRGATGPRERKRIRKERGITFSGDDDLDAE